jgi:hypothetical protein
MQPTNRKLGRKAILTDSRTLRLSKYFTATLPPPPPSRDWTKGITSWGMLMNDTLGDCTCAGVGHAVQVWTANASTEATITDAEVLSIYENWCGYNPANPATDQGGICLNVLKNWQQQGFSGHRLSAFATVLPANQAHVMQAVNLFGGVYIGLNVPQSVMNNADNNGVTWHTGGDQTIIGGHCVFIAGYDPNGLTIISWGEVYKMTWAFWNAFVDEAYALISPDFIAASGDAPNGFSLTDLESDLVAVTN